jgi:hypothetical protein
MNTSKSKAVSEFRRMVKNNINFVREMVDVVKESTENIKDTILGGFLFSGSSNGPGLGSLILCSFLILVSPLFFFINLIAFIFRGFRTFESDEDNINAFD